MPDQDYPFPTTTLLDDFNRANENPLSQGGNWANWFSAGANLTVVGNECQLFGAGTGAFYRNTATYGPGAECYVTLKTIGDGGGYVAVVVRGNDGGASVRGYAVRLRKTSPGTTRFEIVKYFDNSPGLGTVLASKSITVNDGDGIGISAIGREITAWHRPGALGVWSAVVLVDDGTFSVAGRAALAINQIVSGTTWSVDDFSGGTSTFAPPVGPPGSFFLNDSAPYPLITQFAAVPASWVLSYWGGPASMLLSISAPAPATVGWRSLVGVGL